MIFHLDVLTFDFSLIQYSNQFFRNLLQECYANWIFIAFAQLKFVLFFICKYLKINST